MVLLSSNTKTSSSNYINADNFAKKVNASVKAILAESQTTAPKMQTPTHPSYDNIASELIKLKSLLEAGLISQEDYDAKKKQLLGL